MSGNTSPAIHTNIYWIMSAFTSEMSPKKNLLTIIKQFEKIDYPTCMTERSQAACLVTTLLGAGQQGTPGRSDGESGKICQNQLTVADQSTRSFCLKLSPRGRMPLALLERRQVDPF